ncbi:hypothetical protein AaE_016180 [Aphanomyces astaci]|uniref:DUF7769 domain-containing protein n=1 Tax=Aphanomyces astaci TaxID=112090 RepID=A0A6A4YU53_APHAT|nr:hypothetical protein AaE_016180 [Aphanomyces astaci]
MYAKLLECSVGGELPYGVLTSIAKRFHCHPRTVKRLWDQGRLSERSNGGVAVVASNIKGNSGRPRLRTNEEIEAAVKAVPQFNRQTLRSLEAQSKIPKTTLFQHIKEVRTLKGRSSYIKPLLTDDNKAMRLEFAKSFLRPSSKGGHLFTSMRDIVHIDEKWFFLTKVKRKFYVYEDEEMAHRGAKSKKFITKVMFLAAVARPRFDHNKKVVFDGKIGVWPFVEVVAAQRTSKNRPKGTLIQVPENVNGDVYEAMVLGKVVPAILECFPVGDLERGVFIQHDNASPHRRVTTALLRKEGVSNVTMLNQPPNSPDFNILDLGFFNAIQSLQYQKCTRSIGELIEAVENAFVELPVDTVSKTFITLQKVMQLSIEEHGSNNFKLPHMNKEATIADLTSFNVRCDSSTLVNSQEQVESVLV